MKSIYKNCLLVIFCIIFYSVSVSANSGIVQKHNAATDKAATEKQAQENNLTDAQKQAIADIFSGLKIELAPTALQLVKLVSDLRQNLVAENPDHDLIQKQSEEIAALTGKLVIVKIQLSEKVMKILTPEQRALIRADAKKENYKPEVFELLKKRFQLSDPINQN